MGSVQVAGNSSYNPDYSDKKIYIAVDLKSFYASVECQERGLNPLTTNLVVADTSRTTKTICLAVSPSLKAYGIPGRARLFEVVQKVEEINAKRRKKIYGGTFSGKSYDDTELKANPTLELDYLAAPPRMAKYIEYSTQVYKVYLRYVAPEHIHVYSIDEVMMDATDYIKTRRITPREFAKEIIRDILQSTGITATAGIGTNLYLCKVAMDIVAKHVPADEDGVRIAELDEMSYREQLWDHTPLTDFWRVGKGYAKKLEACGLNTMGDIALCSVGKETDFHNEALLYRMFGVNAELLIDHAWGWEPVGIADIKAYKPQSNSLGAGQVLMSPYTFEKARIIVREMAESLTLDLVAKGLVTNQIVLTIGYDIESLTNPEIRNHYTGEVTTDFYGRKVPKHAHGTSNLERYTSSTRQIVNTAAELYDRIVNKNLLIRRVNIVAGNILAADEVPEEPPQQLSLFDDPLPSPADDAAAIAKERRMQEAMLNIKAKYGKNAILKGTNYEEGATGRDRNRQIGGHKA